MGPLRTVIATHLQGVPEAQETPALPAEREGLVRAPTIDAEAPAEAPAKQAVER
jgi:hypothetical protein